MKVTLRIDCCNQLNSAEIYDPRSGLWSPTASMQMDRAFHTLTTLRDGEVLAVGGANLLGSAERYSETRPVAAAGADRTVACTNASGTAAVRLDGSGSFDPNNDPLSYR
jgi:hypothetical protein